MLMVTSVLALPTMRICVLKLGNKWRDKWVERVVDGRISIWTDEGCQGASTYFDRAAKVSNVEAAPWIGSPPKESPSTNPSAYGFATLQSTPGDSFLSFPSRPLPLGKL